ncbi:agamous-like MADS-box protein AGL82 [Cornus florida]|uniref:agamous-like MADS-box protein AGL82 n=1 Tax=Cornus florida TaxID=4283 RepID=UPI0028A278E3|nr:agamous-like MADS-box protein AGL82 [Cornus florida]
MPKLKKELITNVKSRYDSFQKRRKCLEKKAFELSTLCDVEACLVVHGPDHHGLIDDQQPHMWPNDLDTIRRMFALYKQQSNENRCKLTLDLSNFLKDNSKKKKKKEANETTSSIIVKVEDKKVDETTKNIKFVTSDDEFNNLSMEQLREYCTKLEERIESIKGMVQFLNSNYQNTEDIFLDTQKTHSNYFMPLEEQPISFFSNLEVPDHYPIRSLNSGFDDEHNGR